MVEQVRGKGVAQRVRRQRHCDAGAQRQALDDHPEHDAAHGAAGFRSAVRHKQIVALATGQQTLARFFQVLFDPLCGDFAKRHQTLLVALAENAQHVFRQADVENPQRHQFAHAQATGVHQLEHGAVTHAQHGVGIGCTQQRFHLGFRERLGHAQRLTCRLQLERRVGVDQALAQRPAKVTFENGQATVGGGRLAAGVAC